MSASNLTEAANLFIMTKFDQCFRECRNLIRVAKCEPEQERNHKLIEAATALGIQALAETDMWNYVISFITDVYVTVDLCPPSIIQLCILLHAQVKEYLPCHTIVEIWLKKPHNQKHKQYSEVIKTYAYRVLFPTGSYELLEELSENCVSLTQNERTALLQLSQSKKNENSKAADYNTDCSVTEETFPGRLLESIGGGTQVKLTEGSSEGSLLHEEDHGADNWDVSNNNNKLAVKKYGTLKNNVEGFSTLQSVLKWLYEFIVVKVKIFKHPRFSLLLTGLLAIWALINVQTGDTVSSLGHFLIIWRMFLQRLGLSSITR